MEEYDKLVRDDIPEIIETDGDRPVTRAVSGDEYLAEKLVEEAEEYREDRTEGELADCFEVIAAVCEARGVSLEAVEAQRAEKEARRGGFGDGIVLEAIERQSENGDRKEE